MADTGKSPSSATAGVIPRSRNPKASSITEAEVTEKVNHDFRICDKDGETISLLRPADFDYNHPEVGDEVVAYYNQSHRSGLWRACRREDNAE